MTSCRVGASPIEARFIGGSFRSGAAQRARRLGFTQVELVAAIVFLLLGLLVLAGVMISASRHREELTVESLVVSRAQRLMEEMKGIPPNDVKIYDGNEYPLTGVAGNLTTGNVLQVAVDSTNDRLLVVTVMGFWNVRGTSHTLELRTDIYNPQGI